MPCATDPVRVFVANTPAEWLPRKVLEFTIRRATSRPVEVTGMGEVQRAIPMPRDLRNRPRTPFSFQRFLIPELCGFRGRAIYLDADMQVFADIAQVWDAAMGEHDVLTVREGTAGRRGQFSVVLLDCERLGWRVEDIVAGLDAGRYTYEQLMHEMAVARSVGRTLDPAWNSLERYDAGTTRLLHYTDMNTQPWVSLDNPLQGLWVDALRAAIAEGFLSRERVEQEVRAGHVRPSLLAELDGEQAAPVLRSMDRVFMPPYRALRSGRSAPWTSWRARVAAAARGGWRRLRAGLGR